jgi:hypothetical protein
MGYLRPILILPSSMLPPLGISCLYTYPWTLLGFWPVSVPGSDEAYALRLLE